MTDTTKDAGNTSLETNTTTAQSECNGLLCCPDCGDGLMNYHSSITEGDGITRVVCRKKCQGWKVLQEINRNLHTRSSIL